MELPGFGLRGTMLKYERTVCKCITKLTTNVMRLYVSSVTLSHQLSILIEVVLRFHLYSVFHKMLECYFSRTSATDDSCNDSLCYSVCTTRTLVFS